MSPDSLLLKSLCYCFGLPETQTLRPSIGSLTTFTVQLSFATVQSATTTRNERDSHLPNSYASPLHATDYYQQ